MHVAGKVINYSSDNINMSRTASDISMDEVNDSDHLFVLANAELKQVFGYDRALSCGISCMQLPGAMVIFAANIKRILKLI